jgi:hypothetical protein
MKFVTLSLITEPLIVGDVIHSDSRFLGSHYFKVISKDGSESVVHTSDENGELTVAANTFVLRDRKAIGSLIWKKVGYTTIPPRS